MFLVIRLTMSELKLEHKTLVMGAVATGDAEA